MIVALALVVDDVLVRVPVEHLNGDLASPVAGKVQQLPERPVECPVLRLGGLTPYQPALTAPDDVEIRIGKGESPPAARGAGVGLTQNLAARRDNRLESPGHRDEHGVRVLRPTDRRQVGGSGSDESDVGIVDRRHLGVALHDRDGEERLALETETRPRRLDVRGNRLLAGPGRAVEEGPKLRTCHGRSQAGIMTKQPESTAGEPERMRSGRTVSVDARRHRQTENELRFRSINERIEDLSEEWFGGAVGPRAHDFVCECQDKDCTRPVALTIREYEAVRAHGRRFVVAPSPEHVDTAIEAVVDLSTRYWVVEKIDESGELADDTDPRQS